MKTNHILNQSRATTELTLSSVYIKHGSTPVLDTGQPYASHTIISTVTGSHHLIMSAEVVMITSGRNTIRASRIILLFILTKTFIITLMIKILFH